MKGAVSGVAHLARALSGVAYVPLWLDSPDRPPPRDALRGVATADLAVVGAGFTGLWTALRALERGLAERVVVLEAGRVAGAASGRSGGFVDASLTHGVDNGAGHFPRELATLSRLGRENLDALVATVAAEGIECGLERHGAIDAAVEPWQLEQLAQESRLAAAHGVRAEMLDEKQLRARVDSPSYLGGLFRPDTSVLVDPARLAFGLAEALERRGVTLHESTPVQRLAAERGGGIELTTPSGSLRAARVVLATSAFPPLLRRLRSYVLPVWDYVLASEQLTPHQRESVGWAGREGMSDAGNQFHYYRLTPDDRILFGGYDAVYYFGNGMRERHERRERSFRRLAAHFYATFPQLEGLRFSHAWGGVIDTCSRFCAFYGTSHGGRVAYATGFTGLGVGAARFAADVVNDLVAGLDTERTRLELVRRRPFPVPPEPLRAGVVALTRASLARADAHGGRRNTWLRTLDRFGIGFDS